MLRLTLFAIFAFMLASCAGKAPPAATQPSQPSSQSSLSPREIAIRDTITIADTLRIKDSIIVRETASFRALQKSVDSLVARNEIEKAIDLLKKQVHYYNSLDQLGFRTLQLAELLRQNGQSAEALAILESFAVYKPAINFWIDSANALYDKISGSSRDEAGRQASPEKLEAINSLTAQIRNLKITRGNPTLIADLADSLRAMAPGDSVIAWLDKQVPPATESSDSFCEEQRKTAAENFAMAEKNKANKAKAKTLLETAAAALGKCLERTPSQEMRIKVEKNRELILKRLEN